MFKYVVDRFLKDQEDVFSGLHFYPGIEYILRNIDLEIDIAGFEQGDGKLAHAYRQIVKMVVLWIYRPNNIVHCIQHATRVMRDVADDFACFFGRRLFSQLLIGHLAKNRNAAQCRTNIIMKIGCYPFPYPFDS